MACSEARELIAEGLIGGEVTPARQALLASHLDDCAECRAESTAISALWDRLGDLPAPEPGYRLDARWRSALHDLAAGDLAEEADWRPKRRVFPWPRSPVWQAAIALACLVIGLSAGFAFNPRAKQTSDEVARLREEVAATRALVALAMLREDSASERLRGVDYSGRVAAIDPEVAAALVEAVRHDSSVNVRLAAIDALSNRDALSKHSDVAASLARALPSEESPMVQAALVDYLADARDRQAIGTIEALAARPDLNPAVRERTQFALAKLTH